MQRSTRKNTYKDGKQAMVFFSDSEAVCASHRNTRIQNNEALRRLLEEGREVWGMPSEHQVQTHRMLRARATLQEGKGRKRVQGYALRWYKH
jgi:hypothetical protein